MFIRSSRTGIGRYTLYNRTGENDMNISVDLQHQENKVLGFIEGEIDAFTAPMLREKLAEITLEDSKEIILDLSEVSYMDSTGLGVFVGFFKNAKVENAKLKLTGLSSRLKRLFDITGLGEIMDIESTSGEVN